MASALADHRVADSLFGTPPPAHSRMDHRCVAKQQRIRRYFGQSQRAELLLDTLAQRIHQLNSMNEQSTEHIRQQNKLFFWQVPVLHYMFRSCWMRCRNSVPRKSARLISFSLVYCTRLSKICCSVWPSIGRNAKNLPSGPVGLTYRTVKQSWSVWAMSGVESSDMETYSASFNSMTILSSAAFSNISTTSSQIVFWNMSNSKDS